MSTTTSSLADLAARISGRVVTPPTPTGTTSVRAST